MKTGVDLSVVAPERVTHQSEAAGSFTGPPVPVESEEDLLGEPVRAVDAHRAVGIWLAALPTAGKVYEQQVVFLPQRGLRQEISLDVSQDHFVGVSVVNGMFELFHSATPFGYG